jgi:hypothetical protein
MTDEVDNKLLANTLKEMQKMKKILKLIQPSVSDLKKMTQSQRNKSLEIVLYYR